MTVRTVARAVFGLVVTGALSVLRCIEVVLVVGVN